MKLSVIIPFYNSEAYLRNCLESVFLQQLDEKDFEVLLINDGSTDKSVTCVADLIDTHANVCLIEQDNQGLSVSRNVGVDRAKGEYILYLDSDDRLLPNALHLLVQQADKLKPDMVIGNYVKVDDAEFDSFTAELTDGATRDSAQADSIVKQWSGEEAFAHFFNPRECYVWRMLFKRSFLDKHSIRFVPHLYFEDIIYTVKCYLKCETCVTVNQLFYAYRTRQGSICSTMNMRKVYDINTSIQHLWQMREEAPAERLLPLQEAIFVTFSVNVWYMTHDKSLIPHTSDFIRDIRAKVPRLEFHNSKMQRLVSFLFRYFPQLFLYLKTHIIP